MSHDTIAREVDMDEVLSIEEIKARYAPDWVLIGEPQTDENLSVRAGKVLFHSPDRDEAYRKAAELRLPYFAVRHLGTLPEHLLINLRALCRVRYCGPIGTDEVHSSGLYETSRSLAERHRPTAATRSDAPRGNAVCDAPRRRKGAALSRGTRGVRDGIPTRSVGTSSYASTSLWSDCQSYH
jgi:hypothetical protein